MVYVWIKTINLNDIDSIYEINRPNKSEWWQTQTQKPQQQQAENTTRTDRFKLKLVDERLFLD